MENKKYLEFSCGRAGSGKVNLFNGLLELKIEQLKGLPATIIIPSAGNIETITTPNGVTITLTWENNKVKTVTQAGTTFSITYVGSKTSVGDSKSGIRQEYTFNTDGDCTLEEHFVNNILQLKEVVGINVKTTTDKDGNTKVITYSNNNVKEEITSKVKRAGGEFVKTVTTNYEYYASGYLKGKLFKETTQAITKSLAGAIVHQGSLNTKEYEYLEPAQPTGTDQEKLRFVRYSTNGVKGIVQELTYFNDELDRVFTYHNNHPNDKFEQDLSGFAGADDVEVFRCPNTDRVERISKWAVANNQSVNHGNEFDYERDMLTEMRVIHPTHQRTKFTFEFDSFGRKTCIKDNIGPNPNYVSFNHNVDNQVTATYKNNEQYTVKTNSLGQLQTVERNSQPVISNEYNGLDLVKVKDHVCGQETRFDAEGQIIEQGEVAVSRSLSADEKTLTTTYTIAGRAPIIEVVQFNNEGQLVKVGQEQVYYDGLGRISSIYNLSYNPALNPFAAKRINYVTDDNGVTNYLIESEGNDTNLTDLYTYDSKGNITKTTKQNKVINFQYDEIGRLISDDKYTYKYDTNGNLCWKNNQGFAYNENGDRNMYVQYDALGNPLTHKGISCTWDMRNLVKLGGVSFKYTAGGLRTHKNLGKTTTKYHWIGDKLLAEERVTTHNNIMGSYPSSSTHIYATKHYIVYNYGITGMTGFNWNGEEYVYEKNVFGDIVKIFRDTGAGREPQLVAQYEYSSFGECTIVLSVGGMAEFNAIRYRGYYYDQETGLYYLKSRYYCPDSCRFLNMDDVSVLDQTRGTINGLNLYAYCGNNPIMYIDSEGEYPVFVFNHTLSLQNSLTGPNFSKEFYERLLNFSIIGGGIAYTDRLKFFYGEITPFTNLSLIKFEVGALNLEIARSGNFYANIGLYQAYSSFGIGISARISTFSITGSWDIVDGVTASITFYTGMGVSFDFSNGFKIGVGFFEISIEFSWRKIWKWLSGK